MSYSWLLALIAFNGFLWVGLGAFGAHQLKTILSTYSLDIYKTAIDYGMNHTIVLLALLALHSREKLSCFVPIAVSFLLGNFLFSGSLILLSLTGMRWLGAITPLGGGAYLVGWALIFLSAFRVFKPLQKSSF